MPNFAENLQSIKEKNLYRELVESDQVSPAVVRRGKKELLSFAGNDYFGMSQNSAVKRAAIKAIKKYGVGSGSSRYICGNNSLYTGLEKQIALMKKCDDAIVFPSGYQTAIGVLPALVGEGDLIIADKLIHACLIDGAKLSGAKLMRFRHNDIKHCEELIASHKYDYNKIIIVTELVFSMDGDKGKISELLEIAQKYNCLFLTDGAHELYGEEINLKNRLRHFFKRIFLRKKEIEAKPYITWIKMGTLSKAVGSIGGYVASDQLTIDYLRNFARSAIYTTALPPASIAASLASLKIIAKNNPINRVMRNAKYFCKLMKLPKPESAIVVIVLGDNEKVVKIVKNIAQKDFLISAIRPPTVEPNGARLRITFSSRHTLHEIKSLAQILQKELQQ